jgi:transcriptional regulator GlxA family with amidase domain
VGNADRPGAPGRAASDPTIVAASRAPLRNLPGVPTAPGLSFAEARRTDIVVVADLAIGRDEETRGHRPEAAAWLRDRHAQGALVCSECTGSVLLAEAGLLDGHEATCHRAVVDQFRRTCPKVRLRPERVIVTAGEGHTVITSGANASGTDLVPYLVSR